MGRNFLMKNRFEATLLSFVLLYPLTLPIGPLLNRFRSRVAGANGFLGEKTEKWSGAHYGKRIPRKRVSSACRSVWRTLNNRFQSPSPVGFVSISSDI